MWLSVPAFTSSRSIVAALCTTAAELGMMAFFGNLPSWSRCTRAAAPVFPSMQTAAISSLFLRSMSAMFAVPPPAP